MAKPQFKKNFISARKTEGKYRKHKFAAFDFETNALDGDVIFGTLQFELEPHGERSHVIDVYSAAAMLDSLFAYTDGNVRWFAHNLEYDLLFLIAEVNQRMRQCENYRIELFERGMGNFYKAIIYNPDGERIVLYDSMALYGFKLKDFAKQFSTVGEKYYVDFDNVVFDINNNFHIEYARQDTLVLLDCMVNFDNAFYDIFGIHLKGTISSTALAAWECTLGKDDRFYKLTESQNDFVRAGYFGGLVFITDNNFHDDVVSIDSNSMYPDKMRRFGVPVGVPSHSRVINWQKPGIYKCVFTAPSDLNFGCIGYRDKKGVCWPRGTFESTAFEFEIKKAISWGYKVKVIEGLIFDRIEYPFKKFIDLCETKRAEFKGLSFEIVVKLAQNSVYGKYATKPDGKKIIIVNDDFDLEGWTPYIDINSGSYPIENCYQRETERDTYYMLPHWAAYITARSRENLLSVAELAGDDSFYGDTDSVKMSRKKYNELNAAGVLDIGKGYGQWKLDDEYNTFRACAPKVYVYTEKTKTPTWSTLLKRDIKYSGKGKGIPEKQRTTAFWQSVFMGDLPQVSYNSLGSLNSSLKKGGVRKLNKATRTVTNLDNSSGWWVDKTTGRVKSVSIINGKRVKL